MVVDEPVIIDTNIWIDALGGVPDAHYLLENHIDIAMSAITYAEVASGCDPTELAMFEAFLAAGQSAQTVQVIHTNDQIIRLASAFNKNPVTGRGHGKKRLPDSIIAATAFVTGRTLRSSSVDARDAMGPSVSHSAEGRCAGWRRRHRPRPQTRPAPNTAMTS